MKPVPPKIRILSFATGGAVMRAKSERGSSPEPAAPRTAADDCRKMRRVAIGSSPERKHMIAPRCDAARISSTRRREAIRRNTGAHCRSFGTRCRDARRAGAHISCQTRPRITSEKVRSVCPQPPFPVRTVARASASLVLPASRWPAERASSHRLCTRSWRDHPRAIRDRLPPQRAPVGPHLTPPRRPSRSCRTR